MRGFMKYYIFIFVTLLILCNPQSTLGYARAGLDLCCDVLAPSLFPFFLCSGLLIYSGFCEVLSQLFRPVMMPLFNVGGAGAAAFILGIISGYPLGAATACSLYDSGYLSKPECERLLAFCNNSGPLFILGSVGAAIYHSPKIGIILYLAHICAAFTVGIIFRFYKKNDTKAVAVPILSPQLSMGEVFQKALAGSVNSILTVCGAVVFFSVIANIAADMLSGNGVLRTVFLSLCELTTGITNIAALDISIFTKLVLSAAAAGFAGFCVHLQVMGTAAGRGLSLIPYIIGKAAHAVLAAAYTAILLKFFPITATAFTSGETLAGSFFAAAVYTSLGVAILSILAAMVLILGKKHSRKSKKAVFGVDNC